MLIGFSAASQVARADVSVDFFYNNLSGGSWIEVGDYGYCWQPDAAVSNTPASTPPEQKRRNAINSSPAENPTQILRAETPGNANPKPPAPPDCPLAHHPKALARGSCLGPAFC